MDSTVAGEVRIKLGGTMASGAATILGLGTAAPGNRIWIRDAMFRVGFNLGTDNPAIEVNDQYIDIADGPTNHSYTRWVDGLVYTRAEDSILLAVGDPTTLESATSYIKIFPQYQDSYADDSLIWRIRNRSAAFLLEPGIAEIYGNSAEIEVADAGIEINPYLRNLFIDSLDHSLVATGKMMVWDSAGGRVTSRAIPSGGTLTSVGGGIPVGVTATNNTNSLAAGYGTLISGPTANLITITADTSAISKIPDNNFLGSIYNANSWSSLGAFTNYGTAAAIVSNKIAFASGGDVAYSQALSLSPPTCLEYWKMTLKFRVDVKNATSYGPAIGIRSLVSTALINNLVRFDMSTGVNSGKISLLSGVAYGTSVTSATALSFAATDYIIITIERSLNVFTITARNVTTGSGPITATYPYQYTDGSYLHNTGQASLWEVGPGFTADSLVYESATVKNADIALLTDSKGVGYFANDFYTCFAGQLKYSYPNVIVNGGGGDMIFQLSQRIQELKSLRPKAYLISTGANSIRNGEVGYLARLDSVLTALEPIAPVYILEPLYETSGIDQFPLEAHIVATYPANRIIQIYYAFRDNASNLLNADGVHPNQTGHDFTFQTILGSYKIPGAKMVIQPGQVGIRNQYQAQQPAAFSTYSNGLASRIVGPLLVGDSSLTTGRTQFRVKVAANTNLFAYYSGSGVTLGANNDAQSAGVRWDLDASDWILNRFTSGGAYTAAMMTMGASGFAWKDVHTYTPPAGAFMAFNPSGATDYYMRFNNSTAAAAFYFGVYESSTRGFLQTASYGFDMIGTAGEQGIRLATNGLIGIGTQTPTQQLTVGGQVRINTINNASVFDSVIVINDGVLEARLASSIIGAAPTWNQIANPTGDQSLTFDAGESSTWTNSNTTEDLITINSSTMTTARALSIALTGTAALTNQTGINVSLSGANGTGAQTTYGAIFSNTHTGTSVNVGAAFVASGGSTNTAIRVASGNGRVAIGQDNAAASLDVVGTAILDAIQTHSAGGNANFFTAPGLASTSNTQAALLYLGAAGVDFRVVMNGTTATTLNASRPYATLTIGASAITEAATGTHQLLGSLAVLPPTITAGAGAVTNTSTVYISAAPSASGATNYSLWADAGLARFDGGLNLDPTNTTAGTTGDQTINKPSGTVNIAAAGTTVTVTNSFCSTSSIVLAVLRTNDGTATLKNVVPGAGSFVVTLTAAATGEVSIGWVVIN